MLAVQGILITIIVVLWFRKTPAPVVPVVSVTESPEYKALESKQDSTQNYLDSLQKSRIMEKVTTDSLYNELNRIHGKQYKRRDYYEILRDSISQFDSTAVNNYWTNRVKRPR